VPVRIVEIFLPLERGDGSRQPSARFLATRAELLQRCGGVTIHARAPVEGLWDSGEAVVEDRLVIFEVIDRHFDRKWWASYRQCLCARFQQDEILLRAIPALLP
jgi:hypothetical protein